MSAVLMLAGCSGNSGSSSSGGKTELTFQIWDVAQKEGMEGYVCRLHPAAPGCQH